MSSIEELEAKKKELQLRSDIARLEREVHFRKVSTGLSSKAISWSWIWVLPVSLVGGLFFLKGVEHKDPMSVVIGVILLIPFVLKLFYVCTTRLSCLSDGEGKARVGVGGETASMIHVMVETGGKARVCVDSETALSSDSPADRPNNLNTQNKPASGGLFQPREPVLNFV